MASFFIVHTYEVGERLYTLERYIARYQHRLLSLFFPSNASKHQKRAVIGSTNKKPFTAKEKHSQRKSAPSESKGNAFSAQKQCNYAPISLLFPLNSNAFAHPPLNAYPQSLEPTQQSEATNRKRKYIFCRFILFFYFCIDKMKLLSEHSNRSKE